MGLSADGCDGLDGDVAADFVADVAGVSGSADNDSDYTLQHDTSLYFGGGC